MIDTLLKRYSLSPIPLDRPSRDSLLIKIAPLGKLNKSIEEIVSCFLFSNIQYLNKKFDHELNVKHRKYIKKVYELLFQNSNKFRKSLVFQRKESNHDEIDRIYDAMTNDLSILRIIANLNDYNNSDIKMIYKILKNLIKFSSTTNITRIKMFVLYNIHNIAEALLENIKPNSIIKSDLVVLIVGKLFRTIFKQKLFLEKILNLEFFTELYFYMKSDKFIISNEAFKIIQSLISNNKISREICNIFLEAYKRELCILINSTIVSDLNKNECEMYYLKRRSLRLILTILGDTYYFMEFKEYYLDNMENLKMAMILLNHTCVRIRLKAISILYYFSDIEFRNKKIQELLLKNKTNFEKYFSKLPKIPNDLLMYGEISEKSNFILYQLVRLQNYF